MSKEFYEYISKKLIFYFEENDKNIVFGTRYCLVLDNQEVIDELEKVFKEYAFNNKVTSNWSYTPDNYLKATYNTISLKFNLNEVVIVFKTKNMTEDFLATLRNSKTTMLMITSSPIDSISKGTENFASEGLPFHKDNIVSDIKKNIKSSMLSKVEKAILNFEITRTSEDINSNQSSILEYQNVLSILNNKEITKDDFNSFRLFYDDELNNLDGKKLSNQIKENNKIFEQIDKTIKYGNIEKDLKEDFESSLINKLLKSDEYTWFSSLDYKDIKKSKDLKAKDKDIRLDILEFSLYSKENLIKNTELYNFVENKNFFIANDSSTKAGKLKKNILIFNKHNKENLTLEVNFNRTIKKDIIDTTTEFTTYKNNLIVNLNHKKEQCSFHKIKVLDKNIKNNNYELKVCIINISEDYFYNLTSSYSIKYYKNASKNSLYFISNYKDILINNNKNNSYITNKEVIENDTYTCISGSTLCLKIAEDSILDTKKVNIKILIENIIIPITIVPDIKIISELTPIQAFKLKNSNKFSFKKVLDENKFILNTQEYYAKSEFLNNLNLEEVFINSGCFSLKITENSEVVELYNQIPSEVEVAYSNLINYYRNKKTIPTLTYYDDELINIIQDYINSIEVFFESIEQEQVLNFQIKNILKLGVIEHLDKNKEICFTPLNPLVSYYQLVLRKESKGNLATLNDEFLKKLSCSNLLPYIQNDNKVLYKSIDFSQVNSFEWIYFTPVDNENYKDSKMFVSKLVFEKIKEYISHFNFLFEDINNNQFRINILNTSSYKEILTGILKYFSKELTVNSNINTLMEFYINIYLNVSTDNTSSNLTNNFGTLTDFNKLKDFIENCDFKFNNNYSSTDIANILTKKVKCFIKNITPQDKVLEYAHITFYEITSKSEVGRVKSENIKTGIMLNGLLSGVPSMYYGEQYKTCFGFKSAKKNKFTEFVNIYNSLHQVSATSNPYTNNTSLSTEIQKLSIEDMNKIYASSNWVTFIDPKVDLNFFKSNDEDLLIIHYSDQYTSSTNYDAITVTKKSTQYKNIIATFFKSKNVVVTDENISKLIGMFNAINGDWLLKLNRTNNHFPREKISILSAVKLALAYYSHSNIIWVPLSLEEILRVSCSAGLSQSEGLLSAKNLNFEKGPTSDDIMLIGIEEIQDKLYIHVQPIEVKIGNTDTLLNKAKVQVDNTSNGFFNLLSNSDENDKLIKDSLEHKLTKNFIMQLVITSAEKLELYNICEENYFSKIISDYRERLLNDDFTISSHLKPYIKNGCVIAFNNSINISSYISTASLEIIEIPEQLSIKYLVEEIYTIKDDIVLDGIFNSRIENNYKYLNDEVLDIELLDIESFDIEPLDIEPLDIESFDIEPLDIESFDIEPLDIEPLDIESFDIEPDNIEPLDIEPLDIEPVNIELLNIEPLDIEPVDIELLDIEPLDIEPDDMELLYIEPLDIEPDDIEVFNTKMINIKESTLEEDIGIKVLFGEAIDTKESLFWNPNNTNEILNTNTGIIGTMGTGKTQFTKSLITQLYNQSNKNIGNTNLGILIFDYKGDYNLSKPDFISATNPKVFSIYELPFNPLALSNPQIFKPLLPLHTANSFKDTIGKIYNLGENQKQILFDCITEAYNLKGIKSDDPSTWNRLPPTFKDVYNIYNNNEDIKKNDKLSAVMKKLHQFKIFESDANKTKSLYELIDNIIVLDLSNNDEDIQSLVIAITLDLFYTEMQSQGSSKLQGNYRELKKLILVDEADNFMRYGFSSLKKILKEGREFGVGTILSTQFLDHFQSKDNSYAEYILTWVIHKVPNLKQSDISFVFQTEKNSKEEQFLFNKIKRLDKHSSIVKIGTKNSYYHIKDLAFWQLLNSFKNK